MNYLAHLMGTKDMDTSEARSILIATLKPLEKADKELLAQFPAVLVRWRKAVDARRISKGKSKERDE